MESIIWNNPAGRMGQPSWQKIRDDLSVHSKSYFCCFELIVKKCNGIEAKAGSGENLFEAGAWKTRAMTLSIDNDTSQRRGRLQMPVRHRCGLLPIASCRFNIT